jgi:hypothetical protein
MRENLSRDLMTIVEKIQNGTFSSIDARSLFISVRYAKPHSYILNELGDFVAHYDERNKGILYDHITNFMIEFINFAISGGSIKIPAPLFNQNEIVSALIKVIKTNKILGLNESKFKSQAYNIMCNILDIIAETKIHNTKVANCRFSSVEKSNNGFVVFFCFGPVKGNVINIKGDVKIPALIAVNG